MRFTPAPILTIPAEPPPWRNEYSRELSAVVATIQERFSPPSRPRAPIGRCFPRTLNKIRQCTRKRIHLLNQSEIVMNKLIIILASFCACGAFATSHADDVTAPRSVVVHFGDLDTASWSGAAALYARLNQAAQQVCGDFEPHGQLGLRRLYRSCLQFAISRAVVAVDRPILTQYATAQGVMARPNVPAYFANSVRNRPMLVAER
jgi:UrcA family protein